ncbi:MAG: hypothetical protein LBC20_06810 [Planctomycetaceae bacterium]|nr:hypothetical protein [Planctomycetaceae bacterium]
MFTDLVFTEIYYVGSITRMEMNNDNATKCLPIFGFVVYLDDFCFNCIWTGQDGQRPNSQ